MGQIEEGRKGRDITPSVGQGKASKKRAAATGRAVAQPFLSILFYSSIILQWEPVPPASDGTAVTYEMLDMRKHYFIIL